MIFDTIRDRGGMTPVSALRSVLDEALDDETRPRVGVGRRNGTVAVYYRTMPDENEDPGPARIQSVVQVVAGALTGPATPDEVTFIAVAPVCEAWTVTADAAEDCLHGDVSIREFFERLDETQREVEIETSPV